MYRLLKRLPSLVLLTFTVIFLSNCEDIGASSRDSIADTLKADEVEKGDLLIITAETDGFENFLTNGNNIDSADPDTSLELTAELSNNLWSAIKLGFKSARIILANEGTDNCIGEVNSTSIFIGYCDINLTNDNGENLTIFIETDLAIDIFTNDDFKTITTAGSIWFGFENNNGYAVIGLDNLTVTQTEGVNDNSYLENWTTDVLAILSEEEDIAAGWASLRTGTELSGTSTSENGITIDEGTLTMTDADNVIFSYDYSDANPTWQ